MLCLCGWIGLSFKSSVKQWHCDGWCKCFLSVCPSWFTGDSGVALQKHLPPFLSETSDVNATQNVAAPLLYCTVSVQTTLCLIRQLLCCYCSMYSICYKGAFDIFKLAWWVKPNEMSVVRQHNSLCNDNTVSERPTNSITLLCFEITVCNIGGDATFREQRVLYAK